MEEMVEDQAELSTVFSGAGWRGFLKVLGNCPWVLPVGYQMSREFKAEVQYLPLVIYQVFIRFFILLKGFSCPVEEQSKLEDTSETRHSESGNLANKYYTKVAIWLLPLLLDVSFIR